MPRQTLAKRPATKKRPTPSRTAPAPKAADVAPAPVDKVDVAAALHGAYVLPLSECPQELGWLAPGRTVGLVVMGRLTPDGVAVESIVMKR